MFTCKKRRNNRRKKKQAQSASLTVLLKEGTSVSKLRPSPPRAKFFDRHPTDSLPTLCRTVGHDSDSCRAWESPIRYMTYGHADGP